MGNIVFAAPSIGRFHLHDSLARQLMRRGHRVTVLAADPVTHGFYRAQGMRSWLLPLRRAGAELRGMPIDETTMRDCRIAGHPRPRAGQYWRARQRIARSVPGILHYFGTEIPDLVLFHQHRTGLHRMIDFVAREFGCDVLHTGDGLLPGTMQWDECGVDGDSSKARRTAADYARQPRDEMFLMAALAAMLGEIEAPGLERSEIRAPDLTDRMRATIASIRRAQFGPAWHGLTAWRRASAPDALISTSVASELPDGPFVTVLLQDPDCPRVRIDAEDAPDPRGLVVATQAAVWAIDSTIPIVVVPTSDAMREPVHRMLQDRPGRIVPCSTRDAMTAMTTALAVVTINHPHALAGVLSGTPVLHLGDALYGVSGATTKTTADKLRDDLKIAVEAPNETHREGYLTRTLVYDHVWCDPDNPDSNGLGGLVQTIEERVAKLDRPQQQLVYRAGPVWPAETAEV